MSIWGILHTQTVTKAIWGTLHIQTVTKAFTMLLDFPGPRIYELNKSLFSINYQVSKKKRAKVIFYHIDAHSSQSIPNQMLAAPFPGPPTPRYTLQVYMLSYYQGKYSELSHLNRRD